jgi:hypothetical protein
MTFAAVPALRTTPGLAEAWEPKVTAPGYDPRNVPDGQKQGLTIGMAMTEKQGGSDVRANTTRAYPIGVEGPGEAYELVGHKYFVSAPMCDAFLALAQAPGGLACFLLPRWRPDGTKNPLQLLRLKRKMGFTLHPLATSPTHLITLAVGNLDGDSRPDLITGGMHMSYPYDRMSRVTVWSNHWGSGR